MRIAGKARDRRLVGRGAAARSVREIVNRVARQVEHAPRPPARRRSATAGRTSRRTRRARARHGQVVVAGIVHELAANQRAPLRVHDEDGQAEGDAATSSAVILINRAQEPAHALPRHEPLAAVPGRDRPGDLPDAGRPLPHRRQVGEPVVVSADLRPVGARAEARAARARTTRSARAGWGSRRPESASTAPTTPSSIGYSVSHGCIRMQVPDAEWLFDHVDDRHDGLHRLDAPRSLRLLAVAVVLGAARRCSSGTWRIERRQDREEVDAGKIVAAPRSRGRASTRRARSRSRRSAARSSCSTSGSRTARRARRRRRRSPAASRALGRQGRRLRRRRRAGSARPGAARS